MTPSVSTLCSQPLLLVVVGEASEANSGGVVGGVVGLAIRPAAPDDADPGPCQDAHRVGVVAASGDGALVDVGGPRAGVAGVVREAGDRFAEPFVARPAEVDRLVLAGLLGDRGGAGERSDGVGGVVGFSAVAPLGEHLGCVDTTGPWQAGEDLAVRVLTEAGGHGSVEVLDEVLRARMTRA